MSPSPSTKGAARRTPPAFVPIQDAPLLLAHLDRLVQKWEGTGKVTDDGSRAYLHELIDLAGLLQEHRVDSQVEEVRAQWERNDDDEGTSFMGREVEKKTDNNKWRKDMVLVDVSDSSYRTSQRMVTFLLTDNIDL